MKKALVSLIAILFLFSAPMMVYLLEYSSPVDATQEHVTYVLPYPGILPDNPLYFFKVIRDRLLDLATRDNVKKAELYLLFSDKRIAMAQDLAQKAKDKLALDTAMKAEEYFQQIPKLVTDAKKEGSGPTSSFVETLKLSNAKHQEILQQFLMEFPQGSSDQINAILQLNRQTQRVLQTL